MNTEKPDPPRPSPQRTSPQRHAGVDHAGIDEADVDEAIAETFPASDPIAMQQPVTAAPAVDDGHAPTSP